METINDYLETMNELHQVVRIQEIMDWIKHKFPQLEFKIAWNQPMFTYQGTFIIGFSSAKQHIAISPEVKGIQVFSKEINNAGYTHGSNLFRIKWNDAVDYSLLERMIQFNIDDKQGCTTFWRKG